MEERGVREKNSYVRSSAARLKKKRGDIKRKMLGLGWLTAFMCLPVSECKSKD